jgi:hypothetical protein
MLLSIYLIMFSKGGVSFNCQSFTPFKMQKLFVTDPNNHEL